MKTKIYKLPNGGSVVYTRNRKLRQTIAQIGFLIHKVEKKDFGVAHFVEHMCLKGTKQTPQFDTYNEIKKAICPNLNGRTGMHYLNFNFSRTNKMLIPALDFIANAIFNSTFENERIEKEKDVILKERLRTLDANETEIFLANKQTISDLNSQLYYSIDALIGTEKQIKAITKRKLLSYKAKTFTQNNFYCCVMSSLSPRKFIKLLSKKIYNLLPSGDNSEQKSLNFVINKKSNVKLISHNREKKFSYMLSFVNNWNYADNYYDYTSLAVSTILQKRIQQTLRKSGYIYTSDFRIHKYKSQILAYIKVETTKENFKNTLDAIITEIQKAQTQLIKSQIVKETILNLIYQEDESQPLAYNTVNDIRFMIFSEHNKIYPSYSLRKRRKLISQFNAEKMRNFCKYIFNTENVYLTVLGKDLNKKDYPTIKKLKNMLKIKVKEDEDKTELV